MSDRYSDIVLVQRLYSIEAIIRWQTIDVHQRSFTWHKGELFLNRGGTDSDKTFCIHEDFSLPYKAADMHFGHMLPSLGVLGLQYSARIGWVKDVLPGRRALMSCILSPRALARTSGL